MIRAIADYTYKSAFTSRINCVKTTSVIIPVRNIDVNRTNITFSVAVYGRLRYLCLGRRQTWLYAIGLSDRFNFLDDDIMYTYIFVDGSTKLFAHKTLRATYYTVFFFLRLAARKYWQELFGLSLQMIRILFFLSPPRTRTLFPTARFIINS